MNFNFDSWSWMILWSLQTDFCSNFGRWEDRGHDHRAVANTLLNLGRADIHWWRCHGRPVDLFWPRQCLWLLGRCCCKTWSSGKSLEDQAPALRCWDFLQKWLQHQISISSKAWNIELEHVQVVLLLVKIKIVYIKVYQILQFAKDYSDITLMIWLRSCLGRYHFRCSCCILPKLLPRQREFGAEHAEVAKALVTEMDEVYFCLGEVFSESIFLKWSIMEYILWVNSRNFGIWGKFFV